MKKVLVTALLTICPTVLSCAQTVTEQKLLVATQVNLLAATRTSSDSTFAAIGLLSATRDHFYFLALPDRHNFFNATLVSSTLDGAIDWTVQLGNEEITDLSANESGTITVTSSPLEGQTQIRQYSSEGKLKNSPTLVPEATRAATLSDGSTVILTASGNIRVLAQPDSGFASVLSPDIVNSARVLRLSDDAVAIVDPLEAVLHIFSPAKRTVTSYSAFHPEALRVKSENALEQSVKPGLRLHTFNLSAAAPDVVYCMVSGFSPKQGALVLAINASGQLSSEHRLTIPLEGGRPSVPTDLAANANAIFMLDESGTVYVYPTKPDTEPPAKAGGPAR